MLEAMTNAKLFTDDVRNEPCRLRLRVSQPLSVETVVALLRHLNPSHHLDPGLLEMENANIQERLPETGKQLTRV